MAKVLYSARLEADDVRWLKGYATQRNTTASAILQWAVREARALATGGVPDLELDVPPVDGRSAPHGRVRAAGSPSSPGAAPAAPVRSGVAGVPAFASQIRPPDPAEEKARRAAGAAIAERQRKLNEAKYKTRGS